MSTEKRRISFVKLSPRSLIELGLSSEKTKKAATPDVPVVEKRLSFVKLSKKDLRDLGYLTDSSENIQESCKLDKPRKKCIFPSPNRKSVASIHKIRNTTISRRSTTIKKETKAKDVSKINMYLSNSSSGKKKVNVNISNKIHTGPAQPSRTLGARKELFKIPKSKPTNEITGKLLRTNVNNSNKNILESPLIDIEKAELLLTKVPYKYENLSKLSQPMSRNLSTVKEETQVVSPSTSGATDRALGDIFNSESDYEMNEKLCEQEVNKNEYSNEIRLIYDILKRDKEDFQRYKAAHEERTKEIFKLLNEIRNYSKNEDIEIGQQKTECHSNTITEPNSQKADQSSLRLQNVQELRINLLKTNFNRSKNIAKEKEAQNMYNDLRKAFTLLETPKSNKIIQEGKLNISKKLQDQCLLLLETPKH